MSLTEDTPVLSSGHVSVVSLGATGQAKITEKFIMGQEDLKTKEGVLQRSHYVYPVILSNISQRSASNC